MTLATHIVIAAAVAKPAMAIHPALGFFAALISHYLADAIPHWDYKLHSIAEKEIKAENLKWDYQTLLTKDLRNIALDFFLGLAVAYFFLLPQSTEQIAYFLLMASGAALPDFLQGVYFTRRAEFLKPIQRLHDFMHTEIKLGPYPLIGIPFQLVIFLFSLYLIL